MKSSYTSVFGLFLLLFGINKTIANSFSSLFFDCPTDTLSLCVEDEGVRLPANNKSFLSEGHPDATSCSVHVSQSIKVQPTCQGVVQYEVQLFLFDASDPIVLKSATTTVTDSLFEAELSFDSELSPDTSISQNGIPYTRGCERYHRIKWIVTDSCGEVSICEQLIDLFDCSKPVYASFHEPIHLFTLSGLQSLYTSDIPLFFNDDCTGNETFLVSFNDDQYTPDTTVYWCDYETWGVPDPFLIWIADAGRDLNCNGTIEWNERRLEEDHINLVFHDPGFIDCLEYPLLGGYVKTVKQGGIAETIINFEVPQHTIPYEITDATGYYQITNYLTGLPITITPEKNDFPKLGISTLDLVRVQKHLLGIEEFTSPFQYISADANNSQSVSAIDLVELRKLILGIYTYLPSNTSWRFVAEGHIFADTTYPWPHPGTVTINVDSSVLDINFIGIKIGDVNSSAPFTSGEQIEIRNTKPAIYWIADQQSYQKGDEIEIKIRTNSNIDLQGFQLTIASPDLLFTDVSSARLQLNETAYSNFGDRMTMSWFDENGTDLSKGDIIFTLKAIAIQNGNLKTGLSINSEITESEVYSMQDEIFTPRLLIGNDEEVNISTPKPNPWKDRTTISVNLVEDGNTEIEIFDLNGRLIYSESNYLLKGNNEIILESKNFAARGLVAYSIKNANEVITGKMIVLD